MLVKRPSSKLIWLLLRRFFINLDNLDRYPILTGETSEEIIEGGLKSKLDKFTESLVFSIFTLAFSSVEPWDDVFIDDLN